MFLQKARGEWFNATSNLTAFCTVKTEKHADVKKFRQELVRLISLLFCSAVSEVASMQNPDFDIIDVSMFDHDSLKFLHTQNERSEIVMQWIQRLVVDNLRSGVIDIAPPIVSRVFQEFSLGIVNIASAKKITIIPFPFPYAQLMQFLLTFQALVVPLMAGYSLHAWWVAGSQTFVMILLSWSIHFIAMEIEMPFGDDENDLPLLEMVTNMNESLAKLLHEKVQERPFFDSVRIPPATQDAPCGLEIVPYTRTHPDSLSLSPSAFRKEHAQQHSEGTGKTVLSVLEGHAPSLAPLKQAPAPPEVVGSSSPRIVTNMISPRPNSALKLPADDAVKRLASLSGQIDGQLLQLGQRIEEHLQQIGTDIKTVSMCAVRHTERNDRIDKAGTIGRPIVSAHDSTHLWFCSEQQAADLANLEDDRCN